MTGGSGLKIGMFYADVYTEHNGTSFVAISDWLIESDNIFVIRDNVWQSLQWGSSGDCQMTAAGGALQPVHWGHHITLIFIQIVQNQPQIF